jgi:dethiobiotin synthetase
MRGLFVTGTDTGVGKSVLSAALVAAIAAGGESVRAFKPVVTGLEDSADGDETVGEIADGHAAAGEEAESGWPADHVLLGAAAGMAPEQVSPFRFGPAVSPHLAAELAGQAIEPQRLLGAAKAAAREHTLIVEGVGGLLVPLREDYSVCDFAVALDLPVLIAARPGLGTINHTLLTLRVARDAGLNVLAVVLTPWPRQPSVMESSNRQTIAHIGAVEVLVLHQIGGPEPSELARAGDDLPWHRWLEFRRGAG